jgi:ribosomal protein S12 methylthiotransferase
VPDLVIRTSLITGLPGEGEEEFAELCEFLRELRLERVGAFAFSPEEGTPAAEMEHVDMDVAVKRAEMVEMIQSDIMDAYNASFIGRDLEVLVDGYDEEFEQFYGRTYADSPDIDGRVWLASEDPLREGQFVMVHIDGCIEGDLSGYVLEETV